MKRPRGFTLVELLVVIAIMGILIALMFPAVQAARDAARRAQCQNNLMRLSMGLQQYVAAHECLPAGVDDPGGPISNSEQGKHLSWIVAVLPFVEQGNAYRQIEQEAGAYHEKNQPIRNFHIPWLYCPSLPSANSDVARTCYAGCHHDVEAPLDADNHGVLFLRSSVSYDQITDGRSQTIFLGEKIVDNEILIANAPLLEFSSEPPQEELGFNADDPPLVASVPAELTMPAEPPPLLTALSDLGWISGTRSSLRNTGTPINRTSGAFGRRTKSQRPAGANSPQWMGGFESWHSGGAMFAFGDGAVRFVHENISFRIYQLLGHRADGELIDLQALGTAQ